MITDRPIRIAKSKNLIECESHKTNPQTIFAMPKITKKSNIYCPKDAILIKTFAIPPKMFPTESVMISVMILIYIGSASLYITKNAKKRKKWMTITRNKKMTITRNLR